MKTLIQLLSSFILAFALVGCTIITNIAGVIYGKPIEVVNSSPYRVNVKVAGTRPILFGGRNEWDLTDKGQALAISLRTGNGYGDSAAIVFRAWKGSGYVGAASVENVYVSQYGNYAEVFTITEEGIIRYGSLVCRWR